MAKKKIKLIALDFDHAIIEQNLRQLITEQNKLPYAYNRLNSTDLLCNKDGNSALKNSAYDRKVMENLIDTLIIQHKLTFMDGDGFRMIVREMQKNDLIVAVATRSSRIDEIDYILQLIFGKDHNIIIVGGGGGAAHKRAHLEKIIETINSTNPNFVEIIHTILIDDKLTIINNTIGEEPKHCLGIQIKPGCINKGIELASHYMQTGETKCPGNDSLFFSEFSYQLVGQEPI